MPEDEKGAAAAQRTGDDEVDAVLAEFGGDARAAIRGLLHDLDALAADARAAISHGYVRGGNATPWRRAANLR